MNVIHERMTHNLKGCGIDVSLVPYKLDGKCMYLRVPNGVLKLMSYQPVLKNF